MSERVSTTSLMVTVPGDEYVHSIVSGWPAVASKVFCPSGMTILFSCAVVECRMIDKVQLIARITLHNAISQCKCSKSLERKAGTECGTNIHENKTRSSICRQGGLLLYLNLNNPCQSSDCASAAGSIFQYDYPSELPCLSSFVALPLSL